MDVGIGSTRRPVCLVDDGAFNEGILPELEAACLSVSVSAHAGLPGTNRHKACGMSVTTLFHRLDWSSPGQIPRSTSLSRRDAQG